LLALRWQADTNSLASQLVWLIRRLALDWLRLGMMGRLHIPPLAELQAGFIKYLSRLIKLLRANGQALGLFAAYLFYQRQIRTLILKRLKKY